MIISILLVWVLFPLGGQLGKVHNSVQCSLELEEQIPQKTEFLQFVARMTQSDPAGQAHNAQLWKKRKWYVNWIMCVWQGPPKFLLSPTFFPIFLPLTLEHFSANSITWYCSRVLLHAENPSRIRSILKFLIVAWSSFQCAVAWKESWIQTSWVFLEKARLSSSYNGLKRHFPETSKLLS